MIGGTLHGGGAVEAEISDVVVESASDMSDHPAVIEKEKFKKLLLSLPVDVVMDLVEANYKRASIAGVYENSPEMVKVKEHLAKARANAGGSTIIYMSMIPDIADHNLFKNQILEAVANTKKKPPPETPPDKKEDNMLMYAGIGLVAFWLLFKK